MKNLTTYELISAAHNYYLQLWSIDNDVLEKHPDNFIYQNSVNKYWAKAEELHKILLEMEANGENIKK